MFSPKLAMLVEGLKILPGIGQKGAQRMALHLLEKTPEQAANLADSIVQALQYIRRCDQCRNLCETPKCGICSSTSRDPSLLCVVESPTDVIALENSGGFKGRYFVLYGRLSPLDGIGPEKLGLDQLFEWMVTEPITEIILATNLTVEGEATAHYISDQLRSLERLKGIKLSRIAQGVPTGGELEYVDNNTLSYALSGRKNY